MFLLIFLSLFVVGNCLPTVNVTGSQHPQQCEHDGVSMNVGEHYKPDPCSDCFCLDTGLVECAITGCLLIYCKNPITSPDTCCPVCPENPTCEAPDGTLISGDERVRQPNGSECHCTPDGYTMCIFQG